MSRGAGRVGPGRRRGALLVLPALVPTVFVLAVALGAALLQSTGLLPAVGRPDLGLSAFAVPGGDLGAAVLVSLEVAAGATACAALVGLVTALAAVGGGRRGRLVAALSTLTVPLPHLVAAAATGLLLADSGLLARLTGSATGGWPRLVASPGWVAVGAELAWKESAFIALVVAGTLAVRGPALQETAALLGAGRWQRLRRVTLPLATPALVASSALSFVYAVGSYEVPYLLGPTSPEPLPVLAYRLFTSIDLATRPQAAAVAVATTALCAGSLVVAVVALRRSATWR